MSDQSSTPTPVSGPPETAPSPSPVSDSCSSPAEGSISQPAAEQSPAPQQGVAGSIEEVATAIVDTIDSTAADLLGRLRLAATSQQVATVKSWVKEHFGS